MKKSWMEGFNSIFIASIISQMVDQGWNLIGATGENGQPYPALVKNGNSSFDEWESDSKAIGRELIANDERFAGISVD